LTQKKVRKKPGSQGEGGCLEGAQKHSREDEMGGTSELIVGGVPGLQGGAKGGGGEGGPATRMRRSLRVAAFYSAEAHSDERAVRNKGKKA